MDRADKLCERAFIGVDTLKKMVDTTRKQLCAGATFYQDVSKAELESVVIGMRPGLTTSTPTGHWYYCQNGHPVSVANQPSITPIANNSIVHDRPVWTAHGANRVFRMRSSGRWYRSPACRWCSKRNGTRGHLQQDLDWRYPIRNRVFLQEELVSGYCWLSPIT